MQVAVDKDGCCFFPSEQFPAPHYADAYLDDEPYLSAISALHLYPALGTELILTANAAAKELGYDRDSTPVSREWVYVGESEEIRE